jgi:outer membrane immunogenic protein
MNKWFLTAIGLSFASIAPVSAADMAVKAAPRAVAPIYTWAGWYAGVNVGWGWNNQTANESAVSGAAFPILTPGTPIYNGPRDFRLNSQGVLGGVQAGYNWQTTPNILFGIEADIQGSDVHGRLGCVLPCATRIPTVTQLAAFPVVFSAESFGHRIDWFGTVRGRVGFVSGPALIYLTGGLAYGDVERTGNVAGITLNPGGSTRNTFVGAYSASSTRVGWTIGAGAEGKLSFNPAWSVKGEWLYVDLGNNTDVFSTVFQPGGTPGAGIAATRTDRSSNREHVFRLGLNYQFNSVGGLMAKY